VKASSHELPFVSVIIPVYSHRAQLEECLGALRNQTYPTDRFEVVVVDNGCEPRLVPPLAAGVRLTLTEETRPGSYAARNKGLAVARGEILAFTDTDCVPTPEWIERGSTTLTQLGCDVVGGQVFVPLNERHPSAAELHEAVVGFRQDIFIGRWGFALTANLFAWSKVFERVGPFNADLFSGGDVEWGRRAELRLAYAADAIVVHPPRASLAQLFKKNLRIAGGMQVQAQSQGGVGRALFFDTPSEIVPVRTILECLKSERVREPSSRIKLIATVLAMGLVRAVERVRIQLGGIPKRI
jgi:glycosyltransferase involved in cell wall biosynthesis